MSETTKYTVTHDTTFGGSDVRRDGVPFVSDLHNSLAEAVAKECNTLAEENARLREALELIQKSSATNMNDNVNHRVMLIQIESVARYAIKEHHTG